MVTRGLLIHPHQGYDHVVAAAAAAVLVEKTLNVPSQPNTAYVTLTLR
jgi:hypothetical protein